jgi:hypothetical protein
MKRFLLAAAVLGGGLVVYARGCTLSKTDPDVRLGNHFDHMCQIARDNVKSPVKGVRALGGYLDKNFGDMHAAWGETIVMIERVDDEADHDERAREARDHIFGPVIDCVEDWNEFGEAVAENEEAMELVQHRADRVGRTFEIIFSSRSHHPGKVDLRDLPGVLEHSMFTE